MSRLSAKAPEPLRGPERLEWARVSLEEAVERMVKHPGEPVYQVAVVARWRELDELRAGLERRQAQFDAFQRRLAAVGDQSDSNLSTPATPAVLNCGNCRRFVATAGQHWTGTGWMCTPLSRSGPAPAPSVGV